MIEKAIEHVIENEIENDQSMRGKLLCRVPETGQGLLSPGLEIVVRDGEEAVLVCQGAVGGAFAAGRHALPQDASVWGGACEGAIYYCNVAPIPEFGWTTRAPLPVVADEAGTVETLRAFGMVAIQVIDARRFVAHVVGELDLVRAQDIHIWVRMQIARALWLGLDELAPLLDLDAAAADVAPRTQALSWLKKTVHTDEKTWYNGV